jgi:hypothetical protein
MVHRAKKSRSAPLRTGSNSVADAASPAATLNPSDPNKITVPTSNKALQTCRFTLFSTGASYVDVPPLSRFLHIENNNRDKPILVCQVDQDAKRIEWRRVVCAPAGSDLRPYRGWYGIPRLSGTDLWFLDPKVYDHNCNPIEL